MEGLTLPDPEFVPYDVVVANASALMLVLLGVIVLYTTVHAAIFSYHWHKYNIAPGPFLRRTYIIYFGGILLFLAAILLSAFAVIT